MVDRNFSQSNSPTPKITPNKKENAPMVGAFGRRQATSLLVRVHQPSKGFEEFLIIRIGGTPLFWRVLP